jgi:hypothetical protein
LGEPIKKGAFPRKQQELVRLLEARIEKNYKRLQECSKAEYKVLGDLGYEVTLEENVATATKTPKKGKKSTKVSKEGKKGKPRSEGKAAWFREYFEANKETTKKDLVKAYEKKFKEEAGQYLNNMVWFARFQDRHLNGKYLKVVKRDGVKMLVRSKNPDPGIKGGGSRGPKGSKKDKKGKAKLKKSIAKAKAGAAKGKKKGKSTKGKSEEE